MTHHPSTINQANLYEKLAWIWEYTSPPSDYEDEAGMFIQLIEENAQIPVSTLLDLGCGTGNNDFWLKEKYQVTGIDLSETMLGLAKRNNPKCAYHLGDVRSTRLDDTYDCVILADAADYMLTEDDLLAAFKTAFSHLNKGGVFVTFAEETKERFVQDKTNVITHRSNGVSITAVENFFDPEESDTTYEATFLYLIRQYGDLSIETDRHLCGLFHTATWIRCLEEAGFIVTVQMYPDAGPSFVGIKRL